MISILKNKSILVCVCGGIAAYKSAFLVSRLHQSGASVKVAMTNSATKFITPLTFEALCGQEVITNIFEPTNSKISHINFADETDAIIIAPATANMIAKLANGFADDFITTTILATKAKIFIAPAMNVNMYENSLVQQNLSKLIKLGFHIIDPGVGSLACGHIGKGRMAEPDDIILEMEQNLVKSNALKGINILITLGATIEPIDPVRFISNYSSGKMGFYIAKAAVEAGASVTLICGKTIDLPQLNAEYIHVKTAEEMKTMVLQELSSNNIIIKTAAVADYKPMHYNTGKIKKSSSEELVLRLIKNDDIAAEIGKIKEEQQLFVGFAAETNDIEKNAKKKLVKKNMDLIVANDISLLDSGFESDYNVIVVYDTYGQVNKFKKTKKKELGKLLINLISERYKKNNTILNH